MCRGGSTGEVRIRKEDVTVDPEGLSESEALCPSKETPALETVTTNDDRGRISRHSN